MTETGEPCVNAEEQVDRTPSRGLLERLVESLVTRVGGTPDLILERLVDVILCVRLDNEVPRLCQNSIIANHDIIQMITHEGGPRVEIDRVISFRRDERGYVDGGANEAVDASTLVSLTLVGTLTLALAGHIASGARHAQARRLSLVQVLGRNGRHARNILPSPLHFTLLIEGRKARVRRAGNEETLLLLPWGA